MWMGAIFFLKNGCATGSPGTSITVGNKGADDEDKAGEGPSILKDGNARV